MWKKIISFRFCTNVKINQSKSSINVESFTNLKINQAMHDLPPMPSVSIVRTKEHAQNVVKILKQLKNRYHAWDTETLEIDPKIQSPVSHGKILCMSCFVGPDIDFGNGPRLFIDNYLDSKDLVLIFKEYFEDINYKKVWHNYGFDRHIFFNHGIDVKGFGADTFHMARLYDTSRNPGEYSLSKLSDHYHDMLLTIRKCYLDKYKKKFEVDIEKLKMLKDYELFNNGVLKKIDMKTLFKSKKLLKNGEEGKSFIMPDLVELHTDLKYLNNWITYSVLDAEVTYYLRDTFQQLLQSLPISSNTHTNPIADKYKNNYDIYMNFWRPFGESLTDMEREGIKVNVEYLRKKQADAETDLKLYENRFIGWVLSVQPDAYEFNPGSTSQLQQLLFAPYYRKMTKENHEKVKRYLGRGKLKNEDSETEELDEEALSEDEEKEKEKPDSNNKTELLCVLEKERSFKVENKLEIIKPGRKTALKHRFMTIKGLGIKPLGFTASGIPAIDQPIVKKMLQKESNGLSYAYNQFMLNFNDEHKAKGFEKALKDYESFKTIETLLQTFIIPLQHAADKNGRIHCSLNLNTDTGRLSARRPNLQNQPSLDKDRYRIRYAFEAEKGNKLIVADYGQLELRVLANITNCKSMIEAFRLGGDFHSRTALGMFPEIQEAIDEGKCLLEWDNSKGKSPVPLLKDMFSNLRKKAKTMNFSIAYGKSATGFSKDWNCSVEEATETLNKWYSNRKEVEKWQNSVKKVAIDKGFTQSLLGRYRNLSKKLSEKKTFLHSLRASINTPIQGGAADIVIAAMIKIKNNVELKKLGYKMILQIHDEIILEGPEENAEKALKLVIEDMENPLDYEFPVKLEVDAKIGNNWYESK